MKVDLKLAQQGNSCVIRKNNNYLYVNDCTDADERTIVQVFDI